MTPADFERELYWAGWLMMARRAFRLRPAEGDALVRLIRNAGRTVTFESFASFDGVGEVSRNLNGSHDGIVQRLARLRRKLHEVGCEGVIPFVYSGQKAEGYSISREGARRVEAALRYAYGIDSEELAA